MKKALFAAAYCILVYLLTVLLKVRTSDVMLTMMLYWMVLGRLENKEDEK